MEPELKYCIRNKKTDQYLSRGYWVDFIVYYNKLSAVKRMLQSLSTQSTWDSINHVYIKTPTVPEDIEVQVKILFVKQVIKVEKDFNSGELIMSPQDLLDAI